jgi:hypothetical protein
LDYEKSREKQLMLSILPKHIAHDVGRAPTSGRESS